MNLRPIMTAVFATAVLALTGCTDQPIEPQPDPATSAHSTPSSVEPTSPEPADRASFESQQLSQVIRELFDTDQEIVIVEDNAVLDQLQSFFAKHLQNEEQCPSSIETQPVSASLGTETVADEDNDDDEKPRQQRTLGALFFDESQQAEMLFHEVTTQIETCLEPQTTVEELTHHTDQAVQIVFDAPEEAPDASMVIIQDGNVVLISSSTPAAVVALELTLADHLNEMLR